MKRTGFGTGRTVMLTTAAVSALALACVIGVPAASASSCPQAKTILQTGFSGTAGLSYVSGNVTTTVDQDGDDFQTTSLNHRASGMKIVLPKPHEGDDGLSANGQPTGGTVSINDVFNDTGDPGDPNGDPDSPFPASHATQSYSGPNKPTSNDLVSLNVGPGCMYNLSFDLDVPHTDEAGTGPLGLATQQPGEADTAWSTAVPIPADLKLSANVTIHAAFGGNGGEGTYDLSGDPFWGNNLDDDAKSPPVEPGTATISWQLAPTSATSHGCVVPHLQGVSQSRAASKLKSAGCKVGKVTHKHSSSVHKGRVVSSNPKAGSKRSAGTKVALVVSSG